MKCPKCNGVLTRSGPLTYCLNCGFEPGESRTAPAEPPMEDKSPGEMVILSARQLGRSCVEKCRVLAQDAALLEAKIAEFRAEASKLAKVAQFCEVQLPPEVAAFVGRTGAGTKPTRVPRADGSPRNGWTCPDCGHATVSRWVARHREECPARKAS